MKYSLSIGESLSVTDRLSLFLLESTSDMSFPTG